MISFLIHGLFRNLLFSFPIFEAHRYICVDFSLITLVREHTVYVLHPIQFLQACFLTQSAVCFGKLVEQV